MIAELPDTLFVTAADVMHHTRLSRSKVYEMMATGELQTRRFGRSKRVPTSELQRLVDELQIPDQTGGAE